MKKGFLTILIFVLAALFLSSCGGSGTPVPSLPPVTDHGAVFTHEAAGMTITYPEGWTVLTEEKIDEMYAQVIVMLKDVYKDPSEFEKNKEQDIPVSFAFLHPLDYSEGFNPNVNIIINPNIKLNSNIVTYSSQVLKEASKQVNAGTFEFGEVTPCKVGGIDAGAADITLEQMGLKLIEKQYYVYYKKHLIIITICDIDPAGLNTLQKAVDNIRFS